MRLIETQGAVMKRFYFKWSVLINNCDDVISFIEQTYQRWLYK